MTVRLSALACLLALFCAPSYSGQSSVQFKTPDNCRLEAFYLAPSSGAYVFINTHGLGSDKNEWGSFQKELEERGLGYLSIDLRGHGASRNCGKKADYRTFTKADWAKASLDITTAQAWLIKKGVPAKKIIFCGASVGANLSLKAAAESVKKPAALILLSPGMDYAGIKAADYLAGAPHKILILAAENDPYAWQSAASLSLLAGKAGRPVSAFDGGSGHGVNMFKTPGTAGKIIDWVLDN